MRRKRGGMPTLEQNECQAWATNVTEMQYGELLLPGFTDRSTDVAAPLPPPATPDWWCCLAAAILQARR
jgi:hypothetical protein